MQKKNIKAFTFGKARFTVITENLIRLEWSEKEIFEDGETLFAVNRNHNGCSVQMEETENEIRIQTEIFTLFYRKNGEHGFSPNTLFAEFADGEWRFGMKNEKNLGGTLATLDGVDGYRPTDDGVLSRNGWFILDDSENAVLENDWLKKSLRKRETDLYLFIYGTDYRKALQTLFYVSGKPAMPRKYMLGSWYSRWWAYTDEEILAIADAYEKNDFPLDIMVLDMDWHHHDWTYRGTDECKKYRAKAGYGHAGNLGWTGYTWNRRLIKNPIALLSDLHKRGLKVTLNDHPHDGIRAHEEMYAEFMRDLGLSPESEIDLEFEAGNRRYMEAFFRHAHERREAEGVDFWWVDWQQDHLKPVIKGTRLRHLPWLNHCYYAHSEKDGKRGASFSRFGGIGDHKHPIFFSGDTRATWECLAFEIAFTASSSNAGLFYWGHDTGGFFGEANAELYVRWTQFSGFSACLRAHSERNVKLDRCPWKWGEKEADAMRKIYHLRSRLMPYIYSLAYEGYENGMPMISAMYLAYPDTEEAYRHPEQYQFGKAFLCAPITQPMNEKGIASQTVWIGEGVYYHFFTNEKYEAGTHEIFSPLDEFPLLVRAGVPIPMQKKTNRMTEKSPDELIVRIYPGENGSFTLYEDDGISKEYENGEYLKTKLSYAEENGTIRIAIEPSGKGYEGMPKERSYRMEMPLTEKKLSVIDGCTNAEIFFENNINIVQISKIKANQALRLILQS